jgi:hypothetical protein
MCALKPKMMEQPEWNRTLPAAHQAALTVIKARFKAGFCKW